MKMPGRQQYLATTRSIHVVTYLIKTSLQEARHDEQPQRLTGSSTINVMTFTVLDILLGLFKTLALQQSLTKGGSTGRHPLDELWWNHAWQEPCAAPTPISEPDSPITKITYAYTRTKISACKQAPVPISTSFRLAAGRRRDSAPAIPSAVTRGPHMTTANMYYTRNWSKHHANPHSQEADSPSNISM
jgi:hypothetical protein